MHPRPLTEVLEETLSLVADSGAPLTTAEVADRLDLGRRSTYERLERLVDRDLLETKKVGANGRVWWRPTTTVDTLRGTNDPEVIPEITAEVSDTSGRNPSVGSSVGSSRGDRDRSVSPPDTGDATASVTLDPDGRVRSWNPPAEALTGWAEAEICDEPFSTLFPEGFDAAGDGATRGDVDAPGDIEAALRSARVDGYVEEEGWCERPDGMAFPTSVTITPRGADDDVRSYTAILRDVTDRRRLEAERRLVADVSRTVAGADSFAEGIEGALAAVIDHTEWAYGEAWTPVADGARVEHVVGLGDAEELAAFGDASESRRFEFGEGLPGRVYASGTPEWIPDASEAGRTVFHRTDLAADVGLRAALGVPILTGDRVVAVLTFFLRERRTEDERLVTVVGDVAADVGGLIARKQVEDTLASERALLDQIVSTSPVGLLVTDAEGTIVRANRQARDIVGRTDDPLVGEAFEALDVAFLTADGEELSTERHPFMRTISRGEAIQGVESKLAREGADPVWVRWSTAPIRGPGEDLSAVTVVMEDVTERRRAERDLAASERTFRAVFEGAFDAIVLADDDARYVDANPAACELFGLPEGELLGRSIESFAPDDYDVEGGWQVFQESDADRGTFPLVRADGERRTVEFAATSNVLPGRHLSVLRDVTERERREEELDKTLQQLRGILDTVEAAIFLKDSEGRYLRMNQNCREVLGVDDDADVVGLTDHDLFPPDVAEQYRADDARVLEAGETIEIEERVPTTDGTRRYLTRKTPLYDEDGEPYAVCAVASDITERKDRERRYDAVFNGTYQFTGLLEPDGSVIEANEPALSFVGLERADVVGSKLWETAWFEHGEAARHAKRAVERAREGEFTRRELEIRGADRLATIDFSIRPVTDEHGEVVYLVPEGRDITDRVEAEREVERQRERLAELNHLNSVIQDITDEVIAQSTPTEIERTVCAALADWNYYTSAWIGDLDGTAGSSGAEVDRAGTDRAGADEAEGDAAAAVTVRTAAGAEDVHDGQTVQLHLEDAPAMDRGDSAIWTGTMRIAGDVDTDTGGLLNRSHDEEDDVPSVVRSEVPSTEGAEAPWAAGSEVPSAAGAEVQSVAMVPLVHDDTGYGMLTVVTDRPDAFESHERAVLGQLGEIVGQAIAAAERKRALMSEEVVELEFDVPGVLDAMGVDVVGEGRLSIDHVVATSDGGHLVYGTMTADAETTLDALVDQHPDWKAATVRPVAGGNRSGFQARVAELPLQSAVASRGGSFEEVRIVNGDLQSRIHLSPTVDARSVIEIVYDTFPPAQLVAKRQFPRSKGSLSRVRESLDDQLTDRQRAALEAAYYGGHFEWPRDSSGADVADSLGIAPSTFSQHLRKAEKAVFDSIFAGVTEP